MNIQHLGDTQDNPPTASARHLPGELGIWILVCGDLVVFSLLFGAFLVTRAPQAALFAASQSHLDANLAALNTCLLLTSSWFVAGAVRAAKTMRSDAARWRLAVTILCGMAFVGIKVFEYHAKIAVGVTPASNDFFMLYYVITGMHLAHVVFGSLFLLWSFRTAFKPGTANTVLIEVGATFWHFVDILWVIIFPLLYLTN